jgi:hypothetical protein
LPPHGSGNRTTKIPALSPHSIALLHRNGRASARAALGKSRHRMGPLGTSLLPKAAEVIAMPRNSVAELSRGCIGERSALSLWSSKGGWALILSVTIDHCRLGPLSAPVLPVARGLLPALVGRESPPRWRLSEPHSTPSHAQLPARLSAKR